MLGMSALMPKEIYSAPLPTKVAIKGRWPDTAKRDMGLTSVQSISIKNLGTKDRTAVFYNGDIPLAKEVLEGKYVDSDYIIYGQGRPEHDRIRFRGITQFFESVDLNAFNQIIIGDMIVCACCLEQASIVMGFTQISSITGKSGHWQYLPIGDFSYNHLGVGSIEFKINSLNKIFNKQTLMTVKILAGCSIVLTFVFPD